MKDQRTTTADKQAAEHLSETPEVKRELERSAGAPPPEAAPVDPVNKLWFTTYLLLLTCLAIVYYVVELHFFSFAETYIPLIERALNGTMGVIFALLVFRAVRVYAVQPIATPAARYNLDRVVKLVAGVTVAFIVLSVLFANWYTAVVSFGLISLILGFALQTPITSFIGWIYILVKVPFQVGDRIKIGDATGDVIALNYLDTTLWEFGGELLSTANHPSGRIIKFPNSKVLNSIVHNYSWPLFPYVWNDVKFQIGYQSDLDFVARVMSECAAEEVGDAMMERIGVYRQLLSQTPVDSLEVKERPVVVFRVAENTWIEAIVRYLVEPKMAGSVKSRLIKKMLERLNAEPERAMFPKLDMR